jgi:hypothetical protein
MSEGPVETPQNALDPMDRISEVLFGTIMALTFTCTLGIATADNIEVRTMLFGALGCNLAWGIIDAGVYLLTRVNNQASKIQMLHAVREAPDLATAQRIIAEALPPLLASILPSEQLELMRQKLRQLPEQPERPQLTRKDWTGALGIGALNFLATFPIVIPFIVIDDTRLALRLSNVIAAAMLLVCGYAFGLRSGLRPWATALSMVVIGGAFVGVAIALGG